MHEWVRFCLPITQNKWSHLWTPILTPPIMFNKEPGSPKVNECPEIPSLSLSNWQCVVSPFMHFPSLPCLSLPFSLYTHNTHEIFTQSILPWTISMAQLVPRVVVLRWRRRRRRRIYAMYAISLLLLLSSREAAGSHPSCDRLAEASQDLPYFVPGN